MSARLLIRRTVLQGLGAAGTLGIRPAIEAAMKLWGVENQPGWETRA